MMIQILQTTTVPGFSEFAEGSVYLVEDSLAADLIARGQAEQVKPPAAKPPAAEPKTPNA